MISTRRNQQGSILLPVSLIGLAITLTLSAFMNHALFLEQSAVENRLAEIRSYWAVMGHFRYALSRTRYAGLCPDDGGCKPNDSYSDNQKAGALQSYLNEIASYRTFTYAEENSSYSILIGLTAADDDDPTRQAFSGHLMMTGSYPTAGISTLPILSGAPLRFTPFQLRFCAGLSASNSLCGPIASNNGGNPSGFYSVKRLVRLNSVS